MISGNIADDRKIERSSSLVPSRATVEVEGPKGDIDASKVAAEGLASEAAGFVGGNNGGRRPKKPRDNRLSHADARLAEGKSGGAHHCEAALFPLLNALLLHVHFTAIGENYSERKTEKPQRLKPILFHSAKRLVSTLPAPSPSPSPFPSK
ncbi:hypothetical protein L484_002718 [Morus notabilis]|uniref:Uncharacterized protein n=1 Tax=Morus notabilis TaxID=981085 RepID=W9RRI4_9ROSA|nr:hypothetical protein L484_002718 [Morus notabilis]